jgi:hypothetical protein
MVQNARNPGADPAGARKRLPGSAVVYDCVVSHARSRPVRNAFTYRTGQWLVDAGDLPDLGPLASFRAADHLGDPRRPIAENVQRYLAGHGIDLAGGQIMMLACPRVLGCVFNPLTVYWCHRPDGSLACVIAEVHNTYQQRHCYLLETDERGRAEVPKEFYVSPFYPVDGSYRMSLPEPDRPAGRLALTIVFRPPGGPPFSASIRGRGRPATLASVARISALYPVPGAAVAARIRWQGIKLYARGLRPHSRPPHAPQEGV